MMGSAEGLSEFWVGLVSFWNLYGLPTLLAILAGIHFARPSAEQGDRHRVVRRLGLIHIGLALWCVVSIVDEFWAAREQGYGMANMFVVVPAAVSTLVDIPLAIGLLRRWRVARWVAVVFNLLGWTLAVWFTHLVSQAGASFDPSEWPRMAVARVLPGFIVFCLLLPATGRVFSRVVQAESRAPTRFDRVLDLLSRLAVVTLVSVVIVDAIDLGIRVVSESFAGR